jgi:hypothetical protein
MSRRASRGTMPRAQRARRRSEASWALSAWSLAGRLRGRPGFPRGPLKAGMASTRGSNWVESWALAAESRTAKGMPWRSTTRWYLEPGLPRSVGFGPVCSPPFGSDAQGVEAGSGPVDGRVVSEPVEEPLVQSLPDASVLPVTQTSPADGPAVTAELLRQQAPRTARAQVKDDPAEGCAVRDTRATAFGLRRFRW